ncbi:hypothetical protein FT663_01797 [Candidozyma haemuli var. vulneris]|nr:hypothetical protein FT662_01909 [[Candida] haemuloni var. vulneris]KAF3993629.1 hypothetical protein FT663_01797 [[Candida] haemuloni var. vulneris]
MSGSSKTLSRHIVSVFENWSNNKNWEKSPSQDIKDLNDTIYAYKERHNSLASLNSQLNNELRSTYSKYIKDSSEISKERLFLDLLTRLSPVLSADEVKVWLATYLLPAIESTGFDISFVRKAKEFIKSVSASPYPTDDPPLRERRSAIARMVVEYVLRIYLGTDQEAYGLIGLEYKDVAAKNQDTHENIEKVRMMEKNCGLILRDYGLYDPEEFFKLLNTYFCLLANRLKTLTLIAMFVSKYGSHSKAILRTPLFGSILRCLLLDSSETVVACALSLMVILMSRVCDSIGPYLPDLLVIYSRLLLWQDPDHEIGSNRSDSISGNYDEKNAKHSWDPAEADTETIAMSSHLYYNDEFNLSYFTTLLYAFFPINLIKFSRKPVEYYKDYQPKILHDHGILFSEDIKQVINKRTRELCEQMRLHPNLLEQITPEEELESPLKWILQGNEGRDMAESDIMLQSLRLNPAFMLWLPDNQAWPKHFHDEMDRLGFPLSLAQDEGQGPSTRELRSSSHWSINLGSNKSSKGGSTDIQHDDYSTPRRSSLVPANLLSEKSPNEPRIKFKNVDYNLPKTVPESASPKPSNATSLTTSENEGGISDLFLAHEKLYKMSNTRRNSVQQELQNPQTATGNFQATAKSASVLLNEQLKGKKDEEVASSKGGALEFYQRELLLCKNELEFTIYMKYLNKVNYIKLKMQLNELSRELAKANREVLQEKETSKSPAALMVPFEELQKTSKSAIKESDLRTEKLSERVLELQKKVDELSEQLTDTKHEKETLEEDFEAYKVSVSGMELELKNLQLKETAERSKAEEIAPAKHEVPDTPRTPEPYISDHEGELQNLRTELEIAISRNSNLERELRDLEEKMDLTVRGYEKKIANSKLDLGGSVREQVSHYERKIQELNATIMKYATSIEEKNNIIMQFTTSKPIKIPGGREMAEAESSPVKPRNIPIPARQSRNLEFGTPDQRGNRAMHEYFDTRSSSGASIRSSTSGQSGQPTRPSQGMFRSPTTQSIPIIKGRGGYQKRSRRM